MEIYELDPIVDNPLFEGFGYEDSPSLLGRSKIGDVFFQMTLETGIGR
jgi:hypothetical protein